MGSADSRMGTQMATFYRLPIRRTPGDPLLHDPDDKPETENSVVRRRAGERIVSIGWNPTTRKGAGSPDSAGLIAGKVGEARHTVSTTIGGVAIRVEIVGRSTPLAGHGPQDTAFYFQRVGEDYTIAPVSLGDETLFWNANGRTVVDAVEISTAGQLLLKTEWIEPVNGGWVNKKGIAVAIIRK